MPAPYSLSVKPLWVWCFQHQDLPARTPTCPSREQRFGVVEWAEAIGVPQGSARVWLRQDRIPWIRADEVACRLGTLPCIIWGEEWDQMDQGLIDGTDKRAIAQVKRSMNKVGKAMELAAMGYHGADGSRPIAGLGRR